MKQAADLHSFHHQPDCDPKHVAVHGFDAQVAKLHGVYKHRRDRMLEALAKYMPEGVHWTKPEGGMFVWVTLPEGMDGAFAAGRFHRQ